MVPAKTSLFHVVMMVAQISQGDLATASITVGLRGSMLLLYMDNILEVHPIKMIPKPLLEQDTLKQPEKGHWHFLMSWV